jgi:hypothetical protein
MSHHSPGILVIGSSGAVELSFSEYEPTLAGTELPDASWGRCTAPCGR